MARTACLGDQYSLLSTISEGRGLATSRAPLTICSRRRSLSMSSPTLSFPASIPSPAARPYSSPISSSERQRSIPEA